MKNKHRFRKIENGWRFRLGGVNGEAYMLNLRYFSRKGFRLTVCFNTEGLVRLFGFNQRVWGL